MAEYPDRRHQRAPADPHFEPTPENARPIKKGDTVLIDLWAKLDEPGARSSTTSPGAASSGTSRPAKYVEIFNTVRDAPRRRGRTSSASASPTAKPLLRLGGRRRLPRRGRRRPATASYFVHRTGHSIGEEVHGNGVNIDNLETKDERLLVPGVCFSIEPGIYLDGEMAVRSEINVYISHAGSVEVAGPMQSDLILVDVP